MKQKRARPYGTATRRICQWCHEIYSTNHPKSRYCSTKCRVASWRNDYRRVNQS